MRINFMSKSVFKEIGWVKILPFYLFTFLPFANSQSIPVYLDDTKPVEQRIDDALTRMTLDEKIAVIHAQSKFSSPGVKRLGFPDLWTDDGPHGVRPDVLWDEWEQAGQTNDSCVAFPALTCLAATWNPLMARLYGESLGEEALYRGAPRWVVVTSSIWVKIHGWPLVWWYLIFRVSNRRGWLHASSIMH